MTNNDLNRLKLHERSFAANEGTVTRPAVGSRWLPHEN